MGLREVHAAQTREAILDAAFSLFSEHGYDRTTMEEIAVAANIGTTTLYRYYPSKDQLVLGPFELRGQMAEELRTRPIDEPLPLALGHTLAAMMLTPRAGSARMRQIRVVLDATPSLSGRLFAQFNQERTLLEVAIADRLDRRVDDLFCRATACMAAAVLELLSGFESRDGGGSDRTDEQTMAHLQSVLHRLSEEPPVLPRL